MWTSHVHLYAIWTVDWASVLSVLCCLLVMILIFRQPFIAGAQNHSEEDLESRTVLVTNVCE